MLQVDELLKARVPAGVLLRRFDRGDAVEEHASRYPFSNRNNTSGLRRKSSWLKRPSLNASSVSVKM